MVATSRASRQAAQVAAVALIVTLAIQMFTALTVSAIAVLAPEIARSFALPPNLVGVFVGMVYLGSMTASLASGGFIERYGAIRVSQCAVLLCAAGIAAVALLNGLSVAGLLLLALAPLVIGIGYGPITAASSHVLVQTTAPSRMALTFSIKQTGVPAGAALAGAALPGLALALGWRMTIGFVAVAGLLIAVAAQSSRAHLDADRNPRRKLSLAGVFAPLKLVWCQGALIELAFTGLIYAATQMCLMSYLVVYLTATTGASLISAGFALTMANLGGIVGRIGWGAVVDRGVAPRTMLGLLGIAAAACAYATASFSSDWPGLPLLAVCAIFGATAIGWNGVQLAEVARLAPAGQAGAITGAAGFLTFGGVVLGPPAFALLAALTGSYRIGFTVFGTLSGLCGLRLLYVQRARTHHPRSEKHLLS